MTNTKRMESLIQLIANNFEGLEADLYSMEDHWILECVRGDTVCCKVALEAEEAFTILEKLKDLTVIHQAEKLFFAEEKEEVLSVL